jgi:hypothetical protein
LTAYGKLSPAGRRQLFSTTGKDNLAKSLEDINFVSSNLNQKLKQFHNPSGTGQSVASTGLAMSIWAHPIAALLAVTSGTRMAKVLSEPATAQATATWMKAYQQAITAPSAGSSLKVRNAAEQLAGIITLGTGEDAQVLAAKLVPGVAAPQSGNEIRPNPRYGD